MNDSAYMQTLGESLLGLLSSGVSRLDREAGIAVMRKIEEGQAKIDYAITFAPFVVTVTISGGGLVLYRFQFESETPRMGWIELGTEKPN